MEIALKTNICAAKFLQLSAAKLIKYCHIHTDNVRRLYYLYVSVRVCVFGYTHIRDAMQAFERLRVRTWYHHAQHHIMYATLTLRHTEHTYFTYALVARPQ